MKKKNREQLASIFKSVESKSKKTSYSSNLFYSQINIYNPSFKPPSPSCPYIFSFYIMGIKKTGRDIKRRYAGGGQLHVIGQRKVGRLQYEFNCNLYLTVPEDIWHDEIESLAKMNKTKDTIKKVLYEEEPGSPPRPLTLYDGVYYKVDIQNIPVEVAAEIIIRLFEADYPPDSIWCTMVREDINVDKMITDPISKELLLPEHSGDVYAKIDREKAVNEIIEATVKGVFNIQKQIEEFTKAILFLVKNDADQNQSE